MDCQGGLFLGFGFGLEQFKIEENERAGDYSSTRSFS